MAPSTRAVPLRTRWLAQSIHEFPLGVRIVIRIWQSTRRGYPSDLRIALPFLSRATRNGSLRLLQFEAMKLFMPFLDRRENPYRKLIRLLGVRLEKLGR